MKNQSRTLILLFIAILTYSCSTINCVGFSERLVGWIPYSTIEKTEFVSGNDTLTFHILTFEKTEEKSYSSFCDCLCSNPIAQFVTDSAKNGCSIKGFIDEEKGLITYSFTQNNKTDSFNYDLTATNTNKTNIRIGDYILPVVEISNTKTNFIKKIFLHNGRGVVCFIDNSDRAYTLIF